MIIPNHPPTLHFLFYLVASCLVKAGVHLMFQLFGMEDPQSLQQNVSFTVTNSSKFIGVATSGDYLNFKYLDGELTIKILKV